MLTQEQIQHYESFYAACVARTPLPNYADRIRSVCGNARSAARHPATISSTVIDELIMHVHNGVATVSGAVDSIWARNNITLSPTVFNDVVKAIFAKSTSVGQISRRQYCEWRSWFFQTARFKANQVYNRLIYSCFPTQFCAVPSPTRLRAIMGKLAISDLLAAFDVCQKTDSEWYDLCELVVPVIREAFPLKDYADHSAFLARIGVELKNKGMDV